MSDDRPFIDPSSLRPVVLPNGESWPHTVFLKNFVSNPNIEIGDYTYYDCFESDGCEDYIKQIAPYTFQGCPEKLIIGKFVQVARGTKFITSSANHQMDGISAYPFAVFGKKWSGLYEANFPNKGDTIIGNDVWFGFESLVMPAVKIGDGAIIGSRSVVTKDVPPYSVVAGNPARIVKKRFGDKDIKKLLEISWWDWPYEVIEDNMRAIVDSDVDALVEVYESIKK